jgi:probable HAF family extracellular repeat protein
MPVDPLDEPSSSLPAQAIGLAQRVSLRSQLGWNRAIFCVWLTSAGVFLASALLSFLRTKRRLRTIPPAPASVAEVARRIARRFGIRRCPEVWLVAARVSPALWAVGRNVALLIPLKLWERLGDDQREALVAHELAHLKRFDHWVRLFELCVTALYWWCPVVWWVRRWLHEAEEHCCDSWVVWALGGGQRVYARTLLDTVDFLADARPVLPVGASGVGALATMKLRLERIMRGTPPRRLTRAGTYGVVGLAGALLPVVLYNEPAIALMRGYEIIDLGPYRPTAINNLGHVVGNRSFATLEEPAEGGRTCRWEKGTWTDIGGPSNVLTFATDINDRGQVTGCFSILNAAQGGSPSAGRWADFGAIYKMQSITYTSSVASGWAHMLSDANDRNRDEKYSYPHAFRTGPNQAINPDTDDLGTLGGVESVGTAINNAGQVVGQSTRSRSPNGSRAWSHAFRTGPNQPINPKSDDLGVNGTAVALNDQGYALVHASRGNPVRSYLARPGRPIDIETDDLGPVDEPAALVRIDSINNQGKVVGEYSSLQRTRVQHNVALGTPNQSGFRFGQHEMRGIQYPHVVNNKGVVLAEVPSRGPHPSNRFALYDGKHVYRLRDLIPAGSNWLLVPVDMNDRGQIVGWGINPQGLGRILARTGAGNKVDLLVFGRHDPHRPGPHFRSSKNVKWCRLTSQNGGTDLEGEAAAKMPWIVSSRWCLFS